MKVSKPLLIGVSASFVIVLSAFFGLKHAFGKPVPSPIIQHLTEVIRSAQNTVRVHQPIADQENAIVETSKAAAESARQAICAYDKASCVKAQLDPLGSGIDLSRFLVPAPK